MVKDIPPFLVVSFCSFWVILCCTGHMSLHVKQISRIPFYTHCRLYLGLWLVLHPLGLELDKALFGSNSVISHRSSHTYYCRNTCGKSHASSVQITSTQQHDYCDDTTNTIVETRAQRAHGSQPGNNLQAGETGDDSQEEALAIAAPQQPIMAAPPPVNPAPPAPAFTLGPGRENMVLDWLTPANTKLYYKVIAALDNKFDGTPEKLIALLASITSQARQFGWNSILTIPMAMDTRELLSDYSRMSKAEINGHATTYTGTWPGQPKTPRCCTTSS